MLHLAIVFSVAGLGAYILINDGRLGFVDFGHLPTSLLIGMAVTAALLLTIRYL